MLCFVCCYRCGLILVCRGAVLGALGWCTGLDVRLGRGWRFWLWSVRVLHHGRVLAVVALEICFFGVLGEFPWCFEASPCALRFRLGGVEVPGQMSGVSVVVEPWCPSVLPRWTMAGPRFAPPRAGPSSAVYSLRIKAPCSASVVVVAFGVVHFVVCFSFFLSLIVLEVGIDRLPGFRHRTRIRPFCRGHSPQVLAFTSIHPRSSPRGLSERIPPTLHLYCS